MKKSGRPGRWKRLAGESRSSVTPRPARQPSTDHREKRQRIDTTPPPPVTLVPNQAVASQQTRGRPGAPHPPVPPQPKSTIVPTKPRQTSSQGHATTAPAHAARVGPYHQPRGRHDPRAHAGETPRGQGSGSPTHRIGPGCGVAARTTPEPHAAQPGDTAVKTEPEDTTTPAPEASSAPQRVTVVTRYANKQPSEQQPDALPLQRQPSPEEPIDYNRTISNDSAPTLPGQDDTSPEPSSATERDNTPEPENYTPPDVGSRSQPPPPPAPRRHQQRSFANNHRHKPEPDTEMRCDQCDHLIASTYLAEACDVCGWWSIPPTKSWYCPGCQNYHRCRRHCRTNVVPRTQPHYPTE